MKTCSGRGATIARPCRCETHATRRAAVIGAVIALAAIVALCTPLIYGGGFGGGFCVGSEHSSCQ